MTTSDMISDSEAEERTALLEELYRAYNDRDIDTVLKHLAPGVDWPNTKTGERIEGREAVRAYWQQQWQESDPTVEPMRINFTPDGTAHVRVDQMVRSLAGEILQNLQVEHVFEFEGPFISRLTIVGLAEGEVDDKHRDDDDELYGDDGGEGEGGQNGEGE